MDGALSSPTNIPSGAASPPQGSVRCPQCETEMPAKAAFCPGCGWSMKALSSDDRSLAAFVYFPLPIPLLAAAVILLLPALRNRSYVRFHAWQSILLWGLFLLLTAIALMVSNVAAPMALLLCGILLVLAMIFLWIVLSLKAWMGERFELPLLGDWAGRLP
jgi:uncharacterized membrane protein